MVGDHFPLHTNIPQVTSPPIRLRPQIWALHEDSTSNHVHVPGRRNDILMLHPDHSLECVLEYYRSSVRAPPGGALYLPWWTCVFCRYVIGRRQEATTTDMPLLSSLGHLGSHRTGPDLLPGRGVLESLRLLRPGGHRSYWALLRSQEVAQVTCQVSYGTPDLRRSCGDPSSHPPELSVVGHCWFRLPVLDQETSLCMVEPAELLDLVRPRSRSRPCYTRHFLCIHAA